jgi:hypothetical protein
VARTIRDAGLLAAVLAATLSAPAHAADADLSAIAPAQAGAFVAGSASSSTDLRSGVAGLWNTRRGAFDWLWRLDAAPATIDTLTDVVPTGGALFAIGSANGSLSVAKLDAATGTLQRSCGGDGIATHSFGAALIPGRAVESGGKLFVVGGTLEFPSRGLIAAIDEGTCGIVDSALVGDGGQATGFAAVDAAAGGELVVSGFRGTDAALFRFDGALHQLGARGYAVTGAFTDVKATGTKAVAVASSDLQCVTLADLDPGCGRQKLGLSGSVLAARPSGGWLVGGSQYGQTTGLQPALAGYSTALVPEPQSAFTAFGALPAGFSDVVASRAGLAGAGVKGYFGSRAPFIFTAQPDGGAPVFSPLPGFDAAAPAPLEPAPPEPPAAAPPAPPAPGPTATAAAPTATVRFTSLRPRPARDGSFGLLTLRCASACAARGVIRARYSTIGTASARLRAGETLTIRLALTAAGQRMLARHSRLDLTVRLRVTGSAAQTFEKRLTLKSRA